MKIHGVAAILDEMPLTPVTPGISPEDAVRCMRVLGTFHGCMMGLVHFSGQTGWERHTGGDEILFILEGETELTQLTAEGEIRQTVRKGDVVQIPAGVWHSQRTRSPVKLLFLTVGEGSEGSATTPTP
ncbi:cupin domain-containing protein [Hyphomicrobium sp.]|uniref:cupin domain-containing protein n=1 Tax=Hyphomicrobium sp. TaxID=82 RepID=UPI0025B8BC87|nr:cupin domain-containing protein [Hyphomicrobium sp.]MCC7254051.1 cupin domain-containing protein [Hyphomicrobium sp.]